MADTVHLSVEKGVDTGKRISVPAAGGRLGRSSRNDVVLGDPALSRHHCRLFFKPGEGLWVADLGSSNATVVNGQPVQEARLRVGDTLLVGDTLMRVVQDEPEAGGPPQADAPALALFEPPAEAPARRARSRISALIAAAAVVAALAVAAWVPKLLNRAAKPPAPAPAALPAPDKTVEVDYEKVQATSSNVFRYALRVASDRKISVQIDDLANDRHVRKEQTMDPADVAALAEAVEAAGFFSLEDEYLGIQPDIYDVWDLSVTLGRRTHRTRVANRVEPEVFRNVREKVEQTGKMELGLWAIQFSPEKLREMAQEAFLLGKKLYDERSIKYGNLAASIQSFQEAEWYLETVEPKPDFYPEMVSGMGQYKQELQETYDNLNFRAERSIRLREWENAAAQLRIICDTIPDRSDPRHADARKKLLDVEGRIPRHP
jgi:hypothetical protein